jgi:hypothetical protein
MIIQDKYLIKSIKFEQYDNMSHPKYTLDLFGNKTCVHLETIYNDYIYKQILNIYKNNNDSLSNSDKIFINGRFYVGEEWTI